MSADTRTPIRPVVLTADGRSWIQSRLDRASERLQRVEDELATERTDALIEERQQLREQVDELTLLLRDAVSPADIVDDPSIVEIGDEVEVEFPDGSRESFLIVHPVEAGMDEQRTSADSPLAEAILGHRPGDRVTVTSPAGVYSCHIVGRDRLG